MRKRFVPGIAMLVLACADDSTLITQTPAVATAVSPHVDVQGERRWSELTDDALWSSIVKADSIADVGLRRPSESSGLDRGQVILNREQRAPFVQLIRDDRSVRITFEDTLLPLLRVRVSSLEALKRLRQQPFVTYVEPGKFVDQDRKAWSSLGCKMKSYSGPGGSTTVSPGDILPWNYSIMSIDKAWTKSNGSGALVGLVDTGVDASCR
jgi:hypothetical protein